MNGTRSRSKRLALVAAVGALLASVPAIGAIAFESDPTDPARNLALPCEELATPGLVPRTSLNIEHVANVCGFVGTDVELQSRRDFAGKVHDYAFVGTMGAGFRIFDVTDPEHPKRAGGYVDSGWQNDVQVGGDVVVSTFDGVSGEDSNASTCLKTHYPDADGQGVDIFRLDFNSVTATFEVNLVGCVANPPGGAHNSTLHPSGQWLAISNCCSDWALDVVDLRQLGSAGPFHRYRLIDQSRAGAAGKCPPGAAFKCVVVTGRNGASASGRWDPHDVHFTRDGTKMFVAAIESTFVVQVDKLLDQGKVTTMAIVPNDDPSADGSADISISHQADVTSDNAILVVTDEAGGGLSNTDCNESSDGLVGAIHFFALKELAGIPQSKGASFFSPKKIGFYVNPKPRMLVDPLGNRLERGCTVHVFRLGGNGTSAPGAGASGLDGVSRLDRHQLVTAWYGAGVWRVDFRRAPRHDDGVAEDARTTWGNTLGWNVMPGADTWSAKEYKGYVYAGDMVRGFDVYRLAS
jgi:hypothetical protein